MLKKDFPKSLIFSSLAICFACVFLMFVQGVSLPLLTVVFICSLFNALRGCVVYRKKNNLEKYVKKQRETYIATLSHDLKIPALAQIRSLELLLNGNTGNVNESQRELLNLTLDSCRHMYDMLSTILAAYKYENNEITLCYEKIQVIPLIDACFEKSFKTIRNKNIHVKINAQDEAFSLYADRRQIIRAFESLVNNCVLSADENTEIVCDVAKSNDGKNVCLSLGFENPYVSPKAMKNMFKQFVTSQEKLDKVGSGLGLYLAGKIIDAHSGSVNVQSKKKNVTAFNIELPCVNECKYCQAV